MIWLCHRIIAHFSNYAIYFVVFSISFNNALLYFAVVVLVEISETAEAQILGNIN